MIVHCSLWKFKMETSRSQIDEIVREFRALEGKIPAIRAIQVGPDRGEFPENHSMAALVFFDDPDGYRKYRAHQDHLDLFYRYLLPNIEGLHMRAATQFAISAEMAGAVAAMTGRSAEHPLPEIASGSQTPET